MAAIRSEDTFLIEIRLARTKWRIKRTTEKITGLFSIGEFAECHPHVTLFGPFTLCAGVNIPQLKKAVETAAAPYPTIPFMMDGYAMNQGLNGAVLAYRVVPSDSLISLNRSVSAAIGPLAETVNTWDVDPRYKWFHVTIANRLDREEGARIFARLTGQQDVQETANVVPEQDRPVDGDTDNPAAALPRPPVLDEDGIRISVIRGEEILAEYDLARHRWFRTKTHSAAKEWQRSLRRFRTERGFELRRNARPKTRGIFVISDLHLGHANIIRYCSRPFPHNAVEEMDKVLIRNWNFTVADRDTVYHLGDLSYKSRRRDPPGYRRLLNGTVTCIAGNHDQNGACSLPRMERTAWDGIPFTLVHDPDDAVPVPGGWVIHGHYHNNDLARYPFMNFRNRRINVSAEVVGYRPVSLRELAGLIRSHAGVPDHDAIYLRSA